MTKKILLNAFNMNCVGHINHGLWTHPRDRSTDYKSLSYWTALAQTLERGLFDGLFLADILGVYDIYGGNVDLTLKESIQLPVNDPSIPVSAMAAVTKNLGFGVTFNLGSEPPFLLARKLSTLDHLTDGRVGWNIVTGYLDSAARALGLPRQKDHDLRYEEAHEGLELLYKLWEGSWADDAVLRDRANRIFADPEKVRKIIHHGKFFDCEGFHLCEPSPQRTPVLYQAGTSSKGSAFAARHAECIFIAAPDKPSAKATAETLRAQAVAQGRRPDDIKILMGLSVITGKTEAEARDKAEDYRRYASPEAGLAHFSASLGVDLKKFGDDDPIGLGPVNAIQSASDTARQKGWTKAKLLKTLGLGGRYPLIVGDPDQVAQDMASWIEEGGVDGFNLTRTVVPESFEDFVRFAVPALQERGLYKTSYAEGTLRQKIFGEGDRLPARHAASHFRVHDASVAAE